MLQDLVDLTPYKRYGLTSWSSNYATGLELLSITCSNNANHPYVTLPSGKQIPRPLTFEESVKAVVENYNTLEKPDGTLRSKEEREALMCYRLDTCTAIAYKYFSANFKIVPLSLDLVHIAPGFYKPALDVDYHSLPGIELNMSSAKYSEHLGPAQAYKHEGWNTLVTDRKLLKTYLLLINRLYRAADFGFYLYPGDYGNEMRDLVLVSMNNEDGIRGDMDLNGLARFVKVLEK